MRRATEMPRMEPGRRDAGPGPEDRRPGRSGAAGPLLGARRAHRHASPDLAGPDRGAEEGPEPQAPARGPGPPYCGVLVAEAAAGVVAAGTAAAGIGVAPETAWPVACAYFARSSRISDWYDELRMIRSNWPR